MPTPDPDFDDDLAGVDLSLERDADDPAPPPRRLQRAGLFGGALLFGVLLALPAPGGLAVEGWRCAAVAALMAAWWVTEAIPIPATALLPLVLFPLLGVLPVDEAAAPFANPVIYLYLGGFLLALGMQRWGLHRRVALSIVALVGDSPRRIAFGFLLATAFVSMWVSNTATALMMLPIGASVVGLVDAERRGHLGVAIALCIAYGATVGGVGTIIGTPPNALLAGFLRETYGVEVGFGRWMLVGVPVVAAGLPLVFAVLMRLYPLSRRPAARGAEAVRDELRAMGRMSGPEVAVACVFGLVATLWVFGPAVRGVAPGLSDTAIAMGGALALFLIPADWRRMEFVLDWRSAEALPWGVLVLFGGGLSLAAAIQATGLAAYVGTLLVGLGGLPTLAVIAAVALVILVLTEVTSNTATAAAFLPVVAALALALGENPLLLAAPAALAASCAFALPVGTPPNAIVFGSGLVTLPQMARAGVWLNLAFVVLVTVAAYLLLPVVFGVVYGQVPAWAAP